MPDPFDEQFVCGTVSAYRDEPWKAFEPITGDFPPRYVPPPRPPQLFNIAADPLERGDLARRHPTRVAEMLRELERWFEDVEADRAAIGGPWSRSLSP